MKAHPGVLLAAFVALASPPATPQPATRPTSWAAPLQVEGLPNLHRVSPTLLRGAQPTAQGLARLPALGVRTVINLREHDSDRPLLNGTGLRYARVPVSATAVDEEDIVRFLRLVTAPDSGGVFVHCQHGADRTGVMVAAYRVVVEGWSKDEAIREMKHGGFGFHWIYWNLAETIRELDVARVRQRVLSAPQ